MKSNLFGELRWDQYCHFEIPSKTVVSNCSREGTQRKLHISHTLTDRGLRELEMAPSRFSAVGTDLRRWRFLDESDVEEPVNPEFKRL